MANIIPAKTRKAVEACMRLNIPFALFSMPGKKKFRFFASLPDSEGRLLPRTGTTPEAFFIGAFAADEPYTPTVYADMDEEDIFLFEAQAKAPLPLLFAEQPYRNSTTRTDYNAAIRGIKSHLRRTKGKTVLSRHTAVFTPAGLLDTALPYLAANPANFSYLCLTPEHGYWYGSTPELLLSAETFPDNRTLRVDTMALAGTRWDSETPWDDKNLLEHKMVADFICDSLASLGLDVTKRPTRTLATNGVEHLCTPIRAEVPVGSDPVNPAEVANALSPTPAVAGYPLDKAIGDIDVFESHQRRCYAGITGVSDTLRYNAFVNLRCAKAAPATRTEHDETTNGWLHNIYAGGGILAESDENTEWEELERKSALLTSLLPQPVQNPTGCETQS